MSETAQRTANWMRRGRHIEDLSDAEILSLAISNEEQASRAYTEFAESLRADYPDTARMFTEMAEEETGHRHKLVELFKSKFGETIPKIDAADVRGLLQERPTALAKLQGPEGMRPPGPADGGQRQPLLPPGRQPHPGSYDPQRAGRPGCGRGRPRADGRRD